jgi:hypothetical protein
MAVGHLRPHLPIRPPCVARDAVADRVRTAEVDRGAGRERPPHAPLGLGEIRKLHSPPFSRLDRTGASRCPALALSSSRGRRAPTGAPQIGHHRPAGYLGPASPRLGHHTVCPISAVSEATKNMDMTNGASRMPSATEKPICRSNDTGASASAANAPPGSGRRTPPRLRPARHSARPPAPAAGPPAPPRATGRSSRCCSRCRWRGRTGTARSADGSSAHPSHRHRSLPH